MSNKSPTSLVNLFIFNSAYGPREGEEEKKILYYFPADTNIDAQIKNVGLCEAIVKFTETFSDKPCEALHTQKHRQLFYEPEKDFWMVMTVSIPFSQKSKDGQTYIEYHEDDIQDSVFGAVLQQAYKMFRLFMGTFSGILEKGSVSSLKTRFEHFFNRYLLTLRLSHGDVLDIFNGISFLPLDKNTYLRIQCFINTLEATFIQIKYTCFLYNDQLVWSGLEQDDMRTMYRYLTTSLFPAYLEQELQGAPIASSTAVQTGGAHYGRYVTGPPNLVDETSMGKIPHVYVNTDSGYEETHLLVYRALGGTICLLIDGTYQLNFDFFRKIHHFLGPQLSSLSSDIAEQYAKRPNSSTEVQYKYIYFNHMNFAQKTTVHNDSKKAVGVSTDVLRTIGDLNHDLASVTSVEDGETIVKTYSDYWVVGKKSDQREFYVIINQKNANLIEINEEVKRLCATNFNNIFFLD